MLKIITATTIAFALMLSVMPYSVQAETAEQDQKIDVDCNVTTGAYGQNTSTTCKVLGKQSQRITLRKGVPQVKALADTGVDTNVAIASTLTIAGGAVAAFLKIKNQA